MVMHLSCSSFLVSVALVSPAFEAAMMPAWGGGRRIISNLKHLVALVSSAFEAAMMPDWKDFFTFQCSAQFLLIITVPKAKKNLPRSPQNLRWKKTQKGPNWSNQVPLRERVNYMNINYKAHVSLTLETRESVRVDLP